MTLIKDMQPSDADKLREYYSSHTETLRGIQITAADEATKYLWASNGGAAVALLAFMNGSSSVRDSQAAHLSLFSFIVGILVLGVLRAINYHSSTSLLHGWILETDRARKSETAIEAPFMWLTEKIRTMQWVPSLFGYVSFGAFIFGVVWGAVHIR